MLSKVLTKNNSKLLDYLLREEASLSELARRIKITKTRAFYSLKELEKLDWVRKTIRGKTHVYRFNFLHSRAKEIIKIILSEKKEEYNKKLKGLPRFIDTFLATVFKAKYQGCLFFGSSLEEREFRDIDLFIMLRDFKQKKELKDQFKIIEERLSLVLGTRKEISKGVKAKDMLYLNIIAGLPFSCEDFMLETKYDDYFLRRTDINERFILGNREIFSCLEFKETNYIKRHLEKGIMDLVYVALNYLELFPRNDWEAKKLFKEKVKLKIPNKVGGAINFANKLRGLVL